MIGLRLALIAGLAAAAAAGAGWFGYQAGSDRERLACADRKALIDATAAATRAAAASATAQAIGKIRVQHQTIRTEVEREIVERPVYRECRHAAGVVRDINAALGATAGSDAAPGDRPGVPASGPAR